MDKLAQRLECSKATLYSLASTKEQLVLAVTRAFFRDATAEIEQAIQAEPDPSGSTSPASAPPCAATPMPSTTTWSVTNRLNRSTARTPPRRRTGSTK
ncbi:TetR/AcrR family transcriptional regulator [Streptomyces sp. NPDC005507]|uniref:TetR/AcrR family transcriptional regulator n=1 Tax=Streptomyces sp. NPDC005507 TaxID=3154885 RepID=UPI0033B05507